MLDKLSRYLYELTGGPARQAKAVREYREYRAKLERKYGVNFDTRKITPDEWTKLFNLVEKI